MSLSFHALLCTLSMWPGRRAPRPLRAPRASQPCPPHAHPRYPPRPQHILPPRHKQQGSYCMSGSRLDKRTRDTRNIPPPPARTAAAASAAVAASAAAATGSTAAASSGAASAWPASAGAASAGAARAGAAGAWASAGPADGPAANAKRVRYPLSALACTIKLLGLAAHHSHF